MNKKVGLNKNRISRRLVLGSAAAGMCVLSSSLAIAQVGEGLPPAANTYRAFADASIARDSGINQPLDLLNDFYPAIEASLTKYDNVRRRSDVQEEDTRLAIMPSLAYRTNLGRHGFYAAYSGRFTYHDDFDQEDSQSNNVAANLGLDISRRWDLNLRGGFGETYEERGVSGSRPFNQFVPTVDSGPDEIDYGFYGIDLVYGQKVSRLTGVLGYERYSSGYKNNFQGDENITGGRDRESESIHLDLSYRVGGRTAVFGRIQETDIDYDRNLNNLDSEQTSYLIGLRWKPSNALSGVIGVGRIEREFDDPRRDNYDGSTYYANLSYAFSPFSSLRLNASRSIEEPGDDLSDFYESDYIGVGWDYGITPNLQFNAFAKWIDDDYNTNRRDEFFDFGLGLDYIFRPWLRGGIFYGEIERDSNLGDLDYEDRYYGIRIRSDLRPLLRGRGSIIEPESFEYPRPTNR